MGALLTRRAREGAKQIVDGNIQTFADFFIHLNRWSALFCFVQTQIASQDPQRLSEICLPEAAQLAIIGQSGDRLVFILGMGPAEVVGRDNPMGSFDVRKRDVLHELLGSSPVADMADNVFLSHFRQFPCGIQFVTGETEISVGASGRFHLQKDGCSRIIKGDIQEGDAVTVDFEGEELIFRSNSPEN